MTRAAPAYLERRTEERRDIHAPARLFSGPKLAMWADCTIRNLSSSGARIELPKIHVCPPRFVLLHLKAGVAYEAVLKWRRGDMAGMAFEATHELAACEIARLAGVREQWQALRAGFGG